MTPGQFTAHVRAWEKKERRIAARSASIACMIANTNRKKGTPAFTIEDFIGEADE